MEMSRLQILTEMASEQLFAGLSKKNVSLIRILKNIVS